MSGERVRERERERERECVSERPRESQNKNEKERERMRAGERERERERTHDTEHKYESVGWVSCIPMRDRRFNKGINLKNPQNFIGLLLLVCFYRQVLQIIASDDDRRPLWPRQRRRLRLQVHQRARPRRRVSLRRRRLLSLPPAHFNAVYFWHLNFSRFDWASSIVLVVVRSFIATQKSVWSNLIGRTT